MAWVRLLFRAATVAVAVGRVASALGQDKAAWAITVGRVASAPELGKATWAATWQVAPSSASLAAS